jgi:hypothetical protein
MNQRLKMRAQRRAGMRSKEMETSRNGEEKKKIPSLNNSFSHPRESRRSCLAFGCLYEHVLSHFSCLMII